MSKKGQMWDMEKVWHNGHFVHSDLELKKEICSQWKDENYLLCNITESKDSLQVTKVNMVMKLPPPCIVLYSIYPKSICQPTYLPGCNEEESLVESIKRRYHIVCLFWYISLQMKRLTWSSGIHLHVLYCIPFMWKPYVSWLAFLVAMKKND